MKHAKRILETYEEVKAMEKTINLKLGGKVLFQCGP